MTDRWEIGDLAVCVSKPAPDPWVPTGLWSVEVGKVYVVIECGADNRGPWLNFAEDTTFREDCAFRAAHFRKIKPDEPKACSADFRLLLDLSRKVRTFDEEFQALERDHAEYRERLDRALAPIEAFGRDAGERLDPEGTKAGIAPRTST